MAGGNIILIGMPSSGKSTVGPLLAERLGKGFIDTDAWIREKVGRELQNIVKEDGLEAFLKLQEEAVLEMPMVDHVVATGGSIVYSERAVAHLKKNGMIVYLKVPFDELSGRLDSGRRLARNAGQTVYGLYLERAPLYEKYADRIIECSGKDVSSIVKEIEAAIGDALLK